MSHQRLTLMERRLMAREGAREWHFTRERDFRLLVVLTVIALAGAAFLIVRLWLTGASYLYYY